MQSKVLTAITKHRELVLHGVDDPVVPASLGRLHPE